MRSFLLILLVVLGACKEADRSKQAAEEILAADKNMNALASTIGFNKALLQYADDSVIKPNDGHLPIIGKQALEVEWKDKPANTNISWRAIRAGASVAGDMGYSFGYWKFTTKDTMLYGNYCTVWKKQKDGAWKFVFDGGNNTPKPHS